MSFCIESFGFYVQSFAKYSSIIIISYESFTVKDWEEVQSLLEDHWTTLRNDFEKGIATPFRDSSGN